MRYIFPSASIWISVSTTGRPVMDSIASAHAGGYPKAGFAGCVIYEGNSGSTPLLAKLKRRASMGVPEPGVPAPLVVAIPG